MKKFVLYIFCTESRFVKGFTLLEVIITLVVAAIASTMLVQFMRSHVVQSVRPVLMLQRDYQAVQGMENITMEYRDQLERDIFNISNFKSNLKTYANDDALTVSSVQIDFDEEGNEISSQSGRYLKVIVGNSNMHVISVFAE
jgi:prepilin-type N-terminal cleavage/methylation domain-containing protein